MHHDIRSVLRSGCWHTRSHRGTGDCLGSLQCKTGSDRSDLRSNRYRLGIRAEQCIGYFDKPVQRNSLDRAYSPKYRHYFGKFALQRNLNRRGNRLHPDKYYRDIADWRRNRSLVGTPAQRHIWSFHMQFRLDIGCHFDIRSHSDFDHDCKSYLQRNLRRLCSADSLHRLRYYRPGRRGNYW